LLDLVIKNGKIVTENDVFDGEIGVSNGQIVQLAKSISDPANRTVDAGHKLILPGLVDSHTHMEMPLGGTVTADDFESGTVAAACGGVTTIIDFAMQAVGSTLLDTYALWREKADPKVGIDYSLHLAIRDATKESLAQIKELIKRGVMSFKLFTTYRKAQIMMSDINICRTMEEATKWGGLVGIHCENNDYIECLVSEYLAQGNVEPEYHAKSRPPTSEVEAVRRVLTLAEFAKAPMYVVHTSTAEAAESIAEARAKGQDAHSETCPHYLTFTDAAYKGAKGKYYVMSPPLRSADDVRALWYDLANGKINTVASDHCCYTLEQKDRGKEDFSKIPNGVPGTEVILATLYSNGVAKGLITLQRLVQVSSSNPAKQFGLYPGKGALSIGSDADLVIFDPKKEMRLSKDNLHSKIDYSPYEDITVKGYPWMTISRGRVVYENGQFTGRRGDGKYVPGKPNAQLRV